MPSDLPAGNNSRYRLVTTAAGDTLLQLTGSFTLTSLDRSFPTVTKELAKLASQSDASSLHWDLTDISQLDYAGAVMLWRIWGEQRPAHLLLRPEQERMFLRLEKSVSLPEQPRRILFLPISMLGKQLLRFLDHLTGMITLSGQIVLDLFF